MKMKKTMLNVGLFAVALLITTAAFAEKKVALELELPEPQFIGTPEDIKTENLDPVEQKDKPALMVPEGLTNIALEKTVTSSDSMPIIGELDLITDGDKEADEGCYVELAPMKQWIQIDLEKSSSLYAIVIWHYHAMQRIYMDVIVQVSDDKDFKKGVTTVFNNDHDNSYGLGKGTNYEYLDERYGLVVDAKGTKGRYVRCYSNGNTGNDMNHYTEVEIYGK